MHLSEQERYEVALHKLRAKEAQVVEAEIEGNKDHVDTLQEELAAMTKRAAKIKTAADKERKEAEKAEAAAAKANEKDEADAEAEIEARVESRVQAVIAEELAERVAEHQEEIERLRTEGTAEIERLRTELAKKSK